MTATQASGARRSSTPYARRLARERNIPLDLLRGTGPHGRIVSADVAAYVPARSPVGASALMPAASALGATINLAPAIRLLADFQADGHEFAIPDAVLRASGCTLTELPDITPLDGAPIALESGRRQMVLTGAGGKSLAPLNAWRTRAMAGEDDEATVPAALSLRILDAGDIRPVLMPLLPGRAMRLILSTGADTAEALLVFDAAMIDEDLAAVFLSRFRSYLEHPLRLLA